MGAGGVEANLALGGGVAGQQVQRDHDRAVGGVVTPELQHRQQRRQHPPIVIRVRRAQHGTHPSLEHLFVGLGLAHQLPQRLLANHRIQRFAHDLVRVLDGGLGQPEQNALLAAHPPQILGQLPLHPPIRPRVDLVDQTDQQVNQRVGDLRGSDPTQRRQQGQPRRPGCGPQVRGIRTGRAGTPRLHQLLRGIREQPRRQPKPTHRSEFVDLPQQRLQPDLSGVGLQLGQQPTPAWRGLVTEQRFQPLGARGVQPRGCQVAEPFLERGACRADDPLDPARWLDLFGAATHQQRLAQLLVAQLDRTDLLGQPAGELVLIAASELAKPERGPHLFAVVLDRSL
jgi:hypothetical protein